jgi:hypothetical protein
MKIPTKLLFGIRTSQTLSLVVTAAGTLPAQLPDLQITSAGQERAIRWSGNDWTVTLASGEHTVRLTADGDRWFDGAVTFTLSAPATIVSRASRTGPLVTFTETTGTATPAEDPKNPWPPPRKAASTPLVEPTWIGTTLTTLGEQVSTDRSAHVPESPAAASPPGRLR